MYKKQKKMIPGLEPHRVATAPPLSCLCPSLSTDTDLQSKIGQLILTQPHPISMERDSSMLKDGGGGEREE